MDVLKKLALDKDHKEPRVGNLKVGTLKSLHVDKSTDPGWTRVFTDVGDCQCLSGAELWFKLMTNHNFHGIHEKDVELCSFVNGCAVLSPEIQRVVPVVEVRVNLLEGICFSGTLEILNYAISSSLIHSQSWSSLGGTVTSNTNYLVLTRFVCWALVS